MTPKKELSRDEWKEKLKGLLQHERELTTVISKAKHAGKPDLDAESYLELTGLAIKWVEKKIT